MDPQEETPMEQETPEANLEPKSGNGNQDTVAPTKMPEHPGRDSDSDGEDSGEEQEP